MLHYETVNGGVNAYLGSGWDSFGENERAGSVICFNERGRVVGTLEWSEDQGVHFAHGTFVDGDHQGQGIATEMWRLALEESGAFEVHVDVVSDRGMTLARSLKKKFPHLEWVICDVGDRKLRVLKKRKGKRGSETAKQRQYYHRGGW